jgi:hypothetical protein
MKTRDLFAGAFVAALVFLVCPSFAQNKVPVADKYLITAKAGGVNEVSGEVTVEHLGGRVGLLVKGDEVEIGERVSTGADGRAEILMNPGSFVRLGANSSFEFASTDLDDVRLKIHKGSAILEVFSAEGFYVDLSTDTARFTILDSGVYRIDANPNGTSTVAVFRGKLRAGQNTKDSLGGGKQAYFDGKVYVVTKFDRDNKDELALWSRDRSRELSKLSASLTKDQVRNPLISSFNNNGWNLYNSFGLWVFDPTRRSYCFLPFGWGWYSPYGFGYGRPIWAYNLPSKIYREPPPAGSIRRDPSEPGRTVVIGGNPGKIADGPSGRDTIRTIPNGGPSEPIFRSAPRMEPIVPSGSSPVKVQTKQP